MKNCKSIIALVLILLFSCMFLSGCNEKESIDDAPRLLTFDMTNEDLSELVNKEVILYAYFMLNASNDTLAYVAPIPFATIYNAQGVKDGTYKEIQPKDAQTYPIFFSTMPDYTSAPIKIEGTLKKVDAYDDNSYISYTYAITDSKYSYVESFSLDKDMKEFSSFSRRGYLDTAYQNIINLQAYAYGYTTEFPEELNYSDIKAELSGSSVQLHKDYLVSLEEIHSLFTTYTEMHNKNKEIDKDKLLEDSLNVLTNFFTVIDKYSFFKVEFNEETNFYKLILANNTASIATPDSAK